MGKIAEVSVTKAGKLKLTTDGYTYDKNKDEYCKFFWVCELRRKGAYRCKSRLVTKLNDDLKHEVLSRFVRAHNHRPKDENYAKMSPEEINAGRVLSFDHIVFWVANAKTAAYYFTTCLGFKLLATRRATKNKPVLAYAVKSNQIKIIFESPTTAIDSKITKDIQTHGDFVKDVAFEVYNLDELVRKAKEGGAEIVSGVTERIDKFGCLRYAVLKTYGNNTHTLVDRSKYRGILWPGFQAVEDNDLNKSLPGTNLMYIDHVEGNLALGALHDSWTWYEKHLNMQRFWCVDYTHELTKYSLINSAAVINKDQNVLLSMNEPVQGQKFSKAALFVKNFGAAGVEHIALYTDDIVATMKSVKARGADILEPPPTYYELIKEKLKDCPVKVAESIEALREGSIMIDFDEEGYMLQAFTKHIQARPTLFIEFIQRRNHMGFGAMNYKWIFEALQMQDRKPTNKGKSVAKKKVKTVKAVESVKAAKADEAAGAGEAGVGDEADEAAEAAGAGEADEAAEADEADEADDADEADEADEADDADEADEADDADEAVQSVEAVKSGETVQSGEAVVA